MEYYPCFVRVLSAFCLRLVCVWSAFGPCFYCKINDKIWILHWRCFYLSGTAEMDYTIVPKTDSSLLPPVWVIHLGREDSSEASIRTDDHRSYQNLSKEMNIETIGSQKGKGLKELHKQIMQFKNWLRGIHHKCSDQHLHVYRDEYVYRFNKRNARKWIFNDVIRKMMNQIPYPYPGLKTLCAHYA